MEARHEEGTVATGPKLDEIRARADRVWGRHEMAWAEFAKWEKASRDTIDVKRCYVDVAGDLVGGVMLSQIVYWHLPGRNGFSKITVQRAGRLWLVKKREDWWEECRVTPRQVDRVLWNLEERGLIETAVWKFHGNPCKHISLNMETFINELREVLTGGRS